MSEDLWRRSAADLAEGVRAGAYRAEDVARSALERIRATDGPVRAWAFLDPDLALAEARAVDARRARGDRALGPLAGVPVGIKDILNTERMPTQMGSAIWKDFRPGNDARVVASLLEADAVALGKTVTAEFAVHHNEVTTNPHDPAYSPGTSSSGSAAAVALGHVPIALGTQTAASIIRPASFCGVYGFKPSFGVVPRTGVLKTLDTLDHIGLLARRAEDLERGFGSMRVRGRNYPHVARFLDPDESAEAPKRWRIAFLRCRGYENGPPHARTAIEDFARRLAKVPGVEVMEAELPADLAAVPDLHTTVYEKALSYYFVEEYEKHRARLSEVFRAMLERGRAVSPAAYTRALEEQDRIERVLDEWIGGFDAVLTLSTAGEAPKGLTTPELPDQGLVWTFCRIPTISLPAFQSPSGLPFGAQLGTRRYRDYTLLRLARFLAEAGLVPAESPLPGEGRRS